MKAPCDSCGVRTSLVCPRERHENVPLCRACECAWVREMQGFQHIVSGPGTPYLRWYRSRWPPYLPPPKRLTQATMVYEAQNFMDQLIDRYCHQFRNIWDREDALLALAERAIRIHQRDAEVIDDWNEYIRRENNKRNTPRRQRWRNNYYTRTIKPFTGVPRGKS